MDVAWRLRLVIFTALALLILGDFYGYGSVRAVKSDSNQAASTGQNENTDIELTEDPNIGTLADASFKYKRLQTRGQLTESIKEACLPKLLCELASKPQYMLSPKEKDLMQLIKSSTLYLLSNEPPSKWHFAAHMGELLRYTGDELSGPMGCANLWPNCPISSKKLVKLTDKVRF